MGQSWLITAPRANEVVNFSGKLGEILFDGSAKCLVMLLAVPVPPPLKSVQDPAADTKKFVGDVDAQWGEDKVHQSEGILSVDDSLCVKRKQEDDFGNSAAEKGRKRLRMQSTDSSGDQRLAFLSLPSELHDLIFEFLDIGDVFNFSLANQYFWEVGQKHIQNYHLSFMGPWAGESIICVGQDIVAGDYPPGMFDEGEEDALRECLDEEGRPMTLYGFIEDYTEIKSLDWLPTTLLGQLLDSKSYYKTLRLSYSQIKRVVHPELSEFYPREELWILRNLTTREYVRSDAIALKPEHIHGPDIDFLGFGEVVLSRICWSTSSSIAMEYDKDIHRGVWAGNRFDITTLARHKEDTKEDEWKDVGEEVAKEIAGIWESEYGSDWREIIC